ncbi:MAG TPA: EF-P lysine aminoacylase EpmA [Polyangia bacterium]|nr:EF-P lysine aminoacylase EpmA [Polyangia bacterium]
MTERERIAKKKLRERSILNRTIRAFFDARDFIEIEAPILVPSPGLELHLDAFAVEDRYLITSPEYQMKRLLGGGMTRIYSLGKVFRRKEAGAQHNPEFTMLEWYRAGADWTAIADDTEALVWQCARTLDAPRAGRCALEPPWLRLAVGEACERWGRVRVYGDEDVATLRARVAAAGWRVPADGDWSDVFFGFFLDAVEPHLGQDEPVIAYDWPAPLCALARPKPSDARVVERFEVYAAGLELCNAFGELVDVAEQRRRLESDRAERHRRGLPEYPIDEKFLAGLATMPDSAGIALGVDRLAMLLLGAQDIRDVIAFADDEL